jgi:mannose-6-phosphate isomerase
VIIIIITTTECKVRKKYWKYLGIFTIFVLCMEEEKKLYPFKFCSLQDDYSWGFYDFRLADLGYRDSLVHEGWLAGNSMGEIMDTYLDRVVGDNVFDYYGRQFPVCVKNIHVKGKMPLRVHPADEISSQRYDSLGKEKIWYVARAGRDARVMLGFRKDTDASEVFSKCLDGSIEDILNIIAPHAGQCFHIAPGTPHAAQGDMLIFEISEASPLDFCLCGWGGEVSDTEFDPSLSLTDSLDFIKYEKFKSDEEPGPHHHHDHDEIVTKVIDIPQFSVTKLQLTDPLHIYSEKFESFITYTCVKGEASVQIHVLNETANFILKEEETMLVPAECPDFFLVPRSSDTLILETTVHRDEPDPYINPDAPAHLPGDSDDEDPETADAGDGDPEGVEDGCGCGGHHHHDCKN